MEDLDVFARLRAGAPTALDGLPVRFGYLYGSQAIGRSRRDSDIDVGVYLEQAAGQRERIISRVADALASATGLGRIEVTVLNDAPLRFLGRVLRQRSVIYSRDEPTRVAFESRVGRMADDVEIWAGPLDRELLTAIAEGRR